MKLPPTPKIEVTFDYKLFKTIPENRDIARGHLLRVKNSIKEDDLTDIVPVLVNEKFQIIDGQNRFISCKELEKPIYYIVKEGLSGKDIIRLNSFTSNWKLSDYLKYYTHIGNKEYIRLGEFIKEYHIIISNAVYMLSMKESISWGDGMRRFRSGEFVCTTYDDGRKFAEELKILRPFLGESVFPHREFIKSYVLFRSMVDFELLLEKLQAFNLKIERQVKKKNYLRQFEDIINFHQKNIKRLF